MRLPRQVKAVAAYLLAALTAPDPTEIPMRATPARHTIPGWRLRLEPHTNPDCHCGAEDLLIFATPDGKLEHIMPRTRIKCLYKSLVVRIRRN